MDEMVRSAMLKWPDVPSVYGWLSLDRRGRWRVRVQGADSGPPRFEPIGNAALNAFIGRNYQPDARGCWYFQNGPQRVFVRLDFMPLVYRLDGPGFADQCGTQVRELEAAWLDEQGSLILLADGRAGGLDGRDLAPYADRLAEGIFEHGDRRLRVGHLASGKIEAMFGFVREPVP
jgi:hypothetical protein